MKSSSSKQWKSELIEKLDTDNYLYWHEKHQIISLFDDVRYDRSDIDILSTSMRKHIGLILKSLGCIHKAGNRYISPVGLSLWMPKPSVLGASSFDATRYTPRQPGDIYILTPTQAVAYWLDHASLEEAVPAIVDMMRSQPCNLRKLEDQINKNSQRNTYLQAMPYLRRELRLSQEDPKLKFKRSLGSVF